MLNVFSQISQIEVVLHTLPGVEITVHSIVRENALIMQNIVHSSRGLVTSSPLPTSGSFFIYLFIYLFIYFLHGRKQLKGTKKKSPLHAAPIKEKKGVSRKRDQIHEERCPDTLL